MSLLTYVIVLAIQGLVVGAFARLALPGRDPLSIFQTISVGLLGTLAAGMLTWLITDGTAAPGFLAALFFAVLVMYLVRRSRGGGLTDPGVVDRRR
jgi:uncharacterized membrane protein YeaQ/YmgE (transglycosylase-associated protein family)